MLYRPFKMLYSYEARQVWSCEFHGGRVKAWRNLLLYKLIVTPILTDRPPLNKQLQCGPIEVRDTAFNPVDMQISPRLSLQL